MVSMQLDKYSQVDVDADSLFDSMYCGKIFDLRNARSSDMFEVTRYNASVDMNADNLPKLQTYQQYSTSIVEFDREHTAHWLMPDHYQTLDIAEWLVMQCDTDAKLARVAEELQLFIQHDMLMVLKYLKYLIDTLRTNDILWGVGRGSSVASYCLYLIGVHKVDSLAYQLDITEFIK